MKFKKEMAVVYCRMERRKQLGELDNRTENIQFENRENTD